MRIDFNGIKLIYKNLRKGKDLKPPHTVFINLLEQKIKFSVLIFHIRGEGRGITGSENGKALPN